MPGKQRNKRITFGQMLFKGAFIHNPALIQVAGICPAAAAAVSLKAGALLANVNVLLLLVTQFIFPRFKRCRAGQGWRLPAPGLGLVCPVILFTEGWARRCRASHLFTVARGQFADCLSLRKNRCQKQRSRQRSRRLSAGIGYAAVLR